MMTDVTLIHAGADDALALEERYQAAVRSGETVAFMEAMDAGYADAPENGLLAAWHARLHYALGEESPARAIAWGWAVPIALLNGLVLWLLSTGLTETQAAIPDFFLMWAPASALAVLIFLAVAGRPDWLTIGLTGIGIAGLLGYTLFISGRLKQGAPDSLLGEQYGTLMALHLPLLAVGGIGLAVLRNHNDDNNRFAFLLKTLEIVIVSGLFAIAVGLFTAITVGLFEALNVQLPDPAMRALILGVGGTIPVLAVAMIYDPTVAPAAQPFGDGMSKLIALLMRGLLPLTLLVLLIYVAFIPFNFGAPFRNRDVLIVYTAMLFAVIALMAGATPAATQFLTPVTARWLRRGMLALAVLSIIVGVYALAAIGYRTWQGDWTPNRLTFIGWDVINLGVLVGVLAGLLRSEEGNWPDAVRHAFGRGIWAYAAWIILVIVGLPLIF
ncbi:MAG: hypothetical protein KDD92_15360 [Caldilineaceae bacterium]|nr:hypothetical protein [Caldilineaceae bacterium]